MSVLIIDSSRAIVKRMKELLSDSINARPIHKAASYKQAVTLFNKTKPGIVVLDMNLPANQSFEMITFIKKTKPDTAIIVLSMHEDKKIQKQCTALGIEYFFDKYHDFEKIPGTIDFITGD